MPTTNKPLFLQPGWNVPSHVKSLITTRHDNFNLAMHVGDNPDHVLTNRDKLNKIVPNQPLWLNQTHSTDVINWDKQEYKLFNADASFTTQQNKVCIVMTADCLPILLTDTSGSFVAAIHAGWRGLNNGIIQNTLAKTSSSKNQIIAFIGPAIDQECFEVGSEVRDAFLQKNESDSIYFTPSVNNDRFMCNLRKIASQRLVDSGINETNITNSNICTKCNVNWFYSYRDNNQTGRFATMIWLE